MFTDYTPQEVQKLKLAVATKKEISLNKSVQKKMVNVKYQGLDDDSKQLAQIITKMKMFSGLDERIVLDVIKSPSLNRYNRSDVILDNNTNTKTIFYILTGSVQVVYADKSGNIVNQIHQSGDIFNEIASLNGASEKKIVYAYSDNTAIFGFILNEALSFKAEYSQIYSSVYKFMAMSVARKFVTYSIQ